MTKRIHIDSECNWPACSVLAPQGDESVIEKTVTIDNKEPRTFDLCKEHLIAFEEIVLPLLETGVKPMKPRRQTKQTPVMSSAELRSAVVTCQHPGCGREIKRRVGMAQHVKAHGYKTLKAYEAQYGSI